MADGGETAPAIPVEAVAPAPSAAPVAPTTQLPLNVTAEHPGTLLMMMQVDIMYLGAE